MVETNWRAVAIGFVTIAVLGIVGAYVEPLAALGTVLGAVIGGFVALPAALGGALGGMMGGAEPSEVRSPST